MEIQLDCLPCFLRQVLEASRMSTERADIQESIMKEAVVLVSRFGQYRYSPEIGRDMHQIIKKHTGVFDPYQETKRKYIAAANSIYPFLKRFLERKQDKHYWALKIAATGNIIDSAIYKDIDIEGCIEKELEKEFSICDIEIFENQFSHAKSLLIIGDNAGETVFDRVLAEAFPHLDITYAVRSEPIINDVTLADAYASGLDHCTKLVSTGCNVPGLIVDECSREFLNIFSSADIIISKGQGNYECLSDENRAIFFLLKAKCPVISRRIGVNVNDYVFQYGLYRS